MTLIIIISAIAGLVVGGVGMYLIGRNVKTVKGAAKIGGVSAAVLLGSVWGVSKYNPDTGVLEQLPVIAGAKIDSVQAENWMPHELFKMPLDSGNTWGMAIWRNDSLWGAVVGTAHCSHDMAPKITPNRLNEKGVREK